METHHSITIRFFAKAKELAKSDEISIEIPDGTAIDELKNILKNQHPELATISEHLLFSVNNEYAVDTRILKSNDEVACFPPVSGG